MSTSSVRLLYRGINSERYEATGGALTPKATTPFTYIFRHDGTIRYDGSATFGVSEQNAVLRHELRQEGWPTSGLSTTPWAERARFYALGGGRFPVGYVLVIDRASLTEHGVREYIVREWLPHPSVPEDDEIILVQHDHGSISASVVIDVLRVSADSEGLISVRR